ncbi:hypothetical protein Xant_21530 [Xanthomonas cissicola]|uniref:Uncharacterized protein n=1 Tax=Xanthomonas cissicola TaxID=86186 RepID=A0ABX3M129_9XANT|nr:hypothetical protein Xant_21530 [Xanthomonas cissicola]
MFHKLFLLTLGQLAHQLDDLTKSIRLSDQGTEGHTKCIGQIQGSLEIWDMRARFVAADASLSDATLQSKSDTQVLLHKANCQAARFKSRSEQRQDVRLGGAHPYKDERELRALQKFVERIIR